MQLATQIDNNVIAAWQTANGAAWCRRLAATITHTVCVENQRRSTHKYGDLRCQGCGGLDNQAEMLQPKHPALALVWDADMEPDGPPMANGSEDVADTYMADRCGCNFDNEEIDDLLAEMFPFDDLDDEGGEEKQKGNLEAPPEPRGRRVPVYVGRCARCGGGYMSNDLEMQFDVRDECVYRCHSCGWRTSPQYENNRALFAAGGVI